MRTAKGTIPSAPAPAPDRTTLTAEDTASPASEPTTARSRPWTTAAPMAAEGRRNMLVAGLQPKVAATPGRRGVDLPERLPEQPLDMPVYPLQLLGNLLDGGL